MSDNPQQPRGNTTRKPAPATGAAAARDARLKAALKANMARRKQQAKARQAPENKNEG